jgi:very-short-patch-repair endonuclease
MFDEVLRRFARDQWVRLHGTPRVTVLCSDARARTIWNQWLAASSLDGTLLEGEVEVSVRDAVAHATREPSHPIAVLASVDDLRRWRANRKDRLLAMVEEGLTIFPNAEVSEAGWTFDARSAAEATLFEALEATRATAGRFKLNQYLSIRFGSKAAEVDLLSRGDRIAIEIDGIHHFADPECYRRDRRKDLLLQGEGLLVVRVLAEDVLRDVRASVNVVCQALAHRQGEEIRGER